MTGKQRTALVTGGSRGIGFGIAKALMMQLDMKVMICGQSRETTERGVAQLRALAPGGEVDGAVCNVRSDQAVRELVARTVERFGSIDVLVNSAGVGHFGHVAEMTPEVWREVIETNLSGVFYCCHEVVPVMRAGGGGYIINIGSLAGVNTFAGGVAYNASKFGLNGFSEALMQDVRYEDIRVSYVLPGSVYTDFGGGRRAGKQDWALEVDDVARVVVDLLGHHPRSLPSRVEIRPSKPPRKK
ncbi:MAG: SDR family oxidoreductase [Acidobacteria bacterium]|nr:SDR family oxidoreductase [Acidobacteriota bacterium]